MELIAWIQHTLQPRICDSEEFFYNEMESQSGYCLPILYQPFDAGRRAHWHDRGAMWDFLLSTGGPGQRLLDFGPGDGWPSLIVAPQAREVIGVDGSERRVEVCRQNAARLGLANARFMHVPPGEKLPFEDDSFDGVMAASSIEQTPDPRATLAELQRVLRPGGRLRMHYESLGVYRHGRQHEAELYALDESTCALTLYERHIEAERANMFCLVLRRPLQEVCAALPAGEEPLWKALSPAALEALLPWLVEARQCSLTHPSGPTYIRWLHEAGFGEVYATHSGNWFAAQLFDRQVEGKRPTDLAGVDALLGPLVDIVIRMPAPPLNPHGWDAMLTAIK